MSRLRRHLRLVLSLSALAAFPASFAAADHLSVWVAVRAPETTVDLKGVELSVVFPKDRITLPGTGATDALRERVRLVVDDVEADDLLVANHQAAEGRLRVVYARQPLLGSPGLDAGPLVRVEFDRTGETAPAPSALGCEVTGASDSNGLAVAGVTCVVESAD